MPCCPLAAAAAAVGCRYKYGLYWDTVSSGAALLLSRKLQDKAYSEQLAGMMEVGALCSRSDFTAYAAAGVQEL
jgi:hypothetical protein